MSTPTPAPNASTPMQTDHFVLSARDPATPGQSGVLIDDEMQFPTMALISKGFQGFQKGKIPTFLDSGVSDTMFVSRDVFVEYKLLSSCVGDSAKAKDGGFEIVGEGNVNQWYKVDGGEWNIMYTQALHTPTLNANIVSISALNKAGLTTTFGNSKGVVQKSDGLTVLTGKNINGMYLLEALDTTSHTPLALNSISQPTSLEQWHCRLAHGSHLMIKDMVNIN